MMYRMLWLLSVIFICSCSTYKGVPLASELVHEVHGSRVSIYDERGRKKMGELLYADAEHLVYLDRESSPKSISKEKIKNLIIYIAHTHNVTDGGASTSAAWMTILHGWWSMVTLPINGIVLSSINKATFRCRYPEDIEWEQLNKFSRFPQGIPEDIDSDSLTYPFRPQKEYVIPSK